MEQSLYGFVCIAVIWLLLLAGRAILYMLYTDRSILDFYRIKKLGDYEEILEEIFFPSLDKKERTNQDKDKQRKILNYMSTIYWINMLAAILYFAALFLIKEYK